MTIAMNIIFFLIAIICVLCFVSIALSLKSIAKRLGETYYEIDRIRIILLMMYDFKEEKWHKKEKQ